MEPGGMRATWMGRPREAGEVDGQQLCQTTRVFSAQLRRKISRSLGRITTRPIQFYPPASPHGVFVWMKAVGTR